MAWIEWMRRRRREQDLDEEIAVHLAMAERERVADGQQPGAARLAALKEFGNVTLTREATRLTWGARWIDSVENLVRDVRYALRLLSRSPAHALVVTAVLALGIGTNLIVFGLFQALALTPLGGVPDSANLHFLVSTTAAGRDSALPYPDYRFLRDRMRAYDGVAGSYVQGWMLGRGAKATRVFGEFVTGNYFDVLGVRPQLGRVLAPSDDVVRRGHPVAVISDTLWRREFGADPAVIGRTIDINVIRLTVVGVTDPAFHGSAAGIATEVFVPYAMQPDQYGGVDDLDDPRTPWVFAVGRPRPGVTLGQARLEAAALSRQLEAERPVDGFSRRVTVVPVWQSPQGAQTYMLPAVTLMGAMSFLLLLVVCANVAGLVLVRNLARRGEIAARLALGAGRARIVRLLLVENVVLAVPGGLLGWWLPRLLEPYLAAAQPSTVSLPALYFNVGGGPVVIVTILLAFLGAFLSGLLPAFRAARVDLASALKDDLSPRGSARSRLRSALVVSQVAMSLLLLVATALVMRSLNAARQADPGFDPRNVASVTLDLLPAGYDDQRGRSFYQQLLERLRNDPGITAASVMKDPLLMLIDFNSREVLPEGYARRRADDMRFFFNVVGTDHFRTLGIPLLAGRDFTARDDSAAPGVTIVNETLARRAWGTPEAAVGKRLQTTAWPQGEMEWRTVVGVARDIKYARLNEAPRPYLYLAHSQAFNFQMTIHARGVIGSAALLETVRRHVREIDADLPQLEATMLSDQIGLGLGVYDVTARTLGIVGGVAIGLMAIGIYGLVAYTVQQSRHDIGIRMAVGAGRSSILRRFLMRGLRLGLVGAAAGVATSMAVTRLMTGLLFGVSPTDLVSFAAAAAAVLIAALTASLMPAWRASRLDPLAALRHQ